MVRNPTPEDIVAGFDRRSDALFRAESGKPLCRAAKRKPLGPGRGNYVRHYSYSMMSFAARCLYLNEMLPEANAALVENAQHYLDNPGDINDRDSFHWHAEIVMRLIEMYGENGRTHPGRITPETEALILKPVWLYVKTCSWLGKAEYKESGTWHVYGSENHHVMDFTVLWQFSKLAMAMAEYKDLQYDAGGTAAEHVAAWNAYFVAYCRERARKGICVEMMSNHYNAVWIKGLYNFFDFGDAQVRRSAGMLLDLYFAYWAQEQIDGVQGGGRSRVYFYEGMCRSREHDMAALGWLNFGIGDQPTISGHELNAALSDYRPPVVVADIARDVAGRGRYEVRQRPQGLGEQGRPNADVAGQTAPNKLRTDGGGILRYSYCDPAFIMGTPMTEARPLADWAAISAQNRWQGVIFPGDNDPRIVPAVRPEDHQVVLNAFWSVQSKGSLITQKLRHHKGGAEMIVWFSEAGLTIPVTEDDIVFVATDGAYAAVRVPQGGFDWSDTVYPDVTPAGTRYGAPPGRTLVPRDEWAPVILEVMAQTDIGDFDAFRARVKGCAVGMDGAVLHYETVYGDSLTFDTSYEATPTINGEAVEYAPRKLFGSPFLNADYNSGVVTIRKGQKSLTLDFVKLEKTRHE